MLRVSWFLLRGDERAIRTKKLITFWYRWGRGQNILFQINTNISTKLSHRSQLQDGGNQTTYSWKLFERIACDNIRIEAFNPTFAIYRLYEKWVLTISMKCYMLILNMFVYAICLNRIVVGPRLPTRGTGEDVNEVHFVTDLLQTGLPSRLLLEWKFWEKTISGTLFIRGSSQSPYGKGHVCSDFLWPLVGRECQHTRCYVFPGSYCAVTNAQ